MKTIRMLIPLAALAATLGGCAYDGYGQGGLSAGYGVADPYYADGYGSYGGLDGFADGVGGSWLGDYYYPGSGVYVIDRGGRRQRWNSEQRRHWQGQGANRPRPSIGPRSGFGGGRHAFNGPSPARPEGSNGSGRPGGPRFQNGGGQGGHGGRGGDRGRSR
jgi:hypothetical protein